MPGKIPEINFHLPKIKIPEAAQKENKQNHNLPSDTKVTSGTLTQSRPPEVKHDNLLLTPDKPAEAETKILMKPEAAVSIQPAATLIVNPIMTAADFADSPIPEKTEVPRYYGRNAPVSEESLRNRVLISLRKNLDLLLKRYGDVFANQETLKNIKEEDLKKSMRYVDILVRTGKLILDEKEIIENSESRDFLFNLAQNYNKTIEENLLVLTVPAYRGVQEFDLSVEAAVGYLEHILLETMPSLETIEVQEKLKTVIGNYLKKVTATIQDVGPDYLINCISVPGYYLDQSLAETPNGPTEENSSDNLSNQSVSQSDQMNLAEWLEKIEANGLIQKLKEEQDLDILLYNYKTEKESNIKKENPPDKDSSKSHIIGEAKSRIQDAIKILKEKSIYSIPGLPKEYLDNNLGTFFKRVENIGHAGLIIILNSNKIESQAGLRFLDEISINYHCMISGDGHILMIPTLPPYSLDVSTEYGVGQLNNIMSGLR